MYNTLCLNKSNSHLNPARIYYRSSDIFFHAWYIICVTLLYEIYMNNIPKDYRRYSTS